MNKDNTYLLEDIIDIEHIDEVLGKKRSLIGKSRDTEGVFKHRIKLQADELPTTNLVVPFYRWCLDRLNLYFEKHSVNCNDCKNSDCPVPEGVQRRKNLLNRWIENIEPETEKKETMNFNKMLWKGTQKQLAELFIELKNKGWIEDFDPKTIKTAFTKSNTIQQVLKPTRLNSKNSSECTYDGVYTERYKPKFYGIIENNK